MACIQFNVSIEDSCRSKLLNILPNMPTVITGFEKSQDETENVQFSAELRTSLFTKEAALKWKVEFEELSHTSYNIDSTFHENTVKTIFKRTYHCLHNTRPPKRVQTPHYKHVNCPAKLIINIKNSKMKRSKDILLREYPCVITIRYTHNHNIFCADVLRHRKPTALVESTFHKLFHKGHSPSSALETYKMELQEANPDNYHEVVADGAKCPTRRWCYELYYSIFKKQYGHPSGPEMIVSLSNAIAEYNKQCDDNCSSMSNDEDELVIAICSPMMKRVHKYLKSSSEIMFIDSSGNMDRHNSRIFLLLCPSVVGALPVGLIMTYSESESSIWKGLELFKAILDDSAFYQNLFPNVIVTDDSAAERQALKRAFPNSRLLLCKFHILQSTMRYLWNSKQGVDKNDRVYIYKEFNKIVNITEENKFFERYESLLKSDVVQKYKNIVKYLENLKQRCKEWALCFRSDILTRGNHTNNYAEAGFRILKDKILHRTKAFSIVQMFHVLTENLNSYYNRRITDVVNNRSENIAAKYFIKDEKIKNFRYEVIGKCLYKVFSNEAEYVVNSDIELCTCYIGLGGAPCKHQYGVVKTFHLSSQQFIPTADVKMKCILHRIISNTAAPIAWFESLKSENNIPQVTVADEDMQNVDRNESIRTPDDTGINAISTFSLQDVETERKKLLENAEKLSSLLLGKPNVFYPAVKKFNELFSKTITESSMISALHTFGKYTGAGQPLIKKRKNLQGGGSIGVQPTALSRRQTHLGGRKVAFTGRPPKNSNDHSYSKKRRLKGCDIPETNKKAAPHSLSFCADNNISLGTMH